MFTRLFGRISWSAPPWLIALLDLRQRHRSAFRLGLLAILLLAGAGIAGYLYYQSQPKPLHYTAVDAHHRHLLQALPSAMRGHKSRHLTPANGYVSHNIDEAQLTLDTGFNLDGELYKPDSKLGPVVVSYGGQASFLQL